jgi:hypothetical protein
LRFAAKHAPKWLRLVPFLTPVNPFEVEASHQTGKALSIFLVTMFPYNWNSSLADTRFAMDNDVGLNRAQVLRNGIIVNWELAEKPVDDKTTCRDLALLPAQGICHRLVSLEETTWRKIDLEMPR